MQYEDILSDRLRLEKDIYDIGTMFRYVKQYFLLHLCMLNLLGAVHKGRPLILFHFNPPPPCPNFRYVSHIKGSE